MRVDKVATTLLHHVCHLCYASRELKGYRGRVEMQVHEGIPSCDQCLIFYIDFSLEALQC